MQELDSLRAMHLRYSEEDYQNPSIQLLRSLAMKIGIHASNAPGGYGGNKLERKELEKLLLENAGDSRFTAGERETIRWM